MYYTESEIDSLFYTQSEINSLFYTKSELDPKLLSVSQKSELTEGGVTSLHYHPTGQLEAWPTYELCGGSGWTETTKTLFHCTFSKSPGSSILRVYSGCSKKTTPGKLWIETSHWGTRYLIPPEVNQWVEREDLFDLTSFTEIVVTAYYIGFINNMTSGESRLYTQQNAP